MAKNNYNDMEESRNCHNSESQNSSRNSSQNKSQNSSQNSNQR